MASSRSTMSGSTGEDTQWEDGLGHGILIAHRVFACRDALLLAGREVQYREFEFGHVDFTFAGKEELRHWLLSRLLKDGMAA